MNNIIQEMKRSRKPTLIYLKCNRCNTEYLVAIDWSVDWGSIYFHKTDSFSKTCPSCKLEHG